MVVMDANNDADEREREMQMVEMKMHKNSIV